MGIDIELLHDVADVLLITKNYFTPMEIALLHNQTSADQPRVFLQCWKLKEA
ncbi:MAG: 4'-phosphopantetheinyl transferase superfamily protein [Bacilli bacterium]